MANVDRVSVRIDPRENALIDLAITHLKLQTGRSISKNDVFLSLVRGLLGGTITLPEFDGLDVAAIVRDADGA